MVVRRDTREGSDRYLNEPRTKEMRCPLARTPTSIYRPAYGAMSDPSEGPKEGLVGLCMETMLNELRGPLKTCPAAATWTAARAMLMRKR